LKDEWKIEIQESEQLLKVHGVLCMINSKGEKLYVKPISHKNGFIELMPLNLKELKELGIEIQESCVNYDFDIEVQESENLPSGEELAKRFEDEKRKKNFQLTNLEDMKKAEEIARHAREVLERKDVSPEELKAENEDLKMKLEIIATKELDRRCQILGIPENSELRAKIRENPSILQGYEQRVKEEMLSGGQIPEGSAPLNKFQLGQNAQGFESVKEMIDHLRKNKTPENEAILKKLFEKTVQGMKQRNSVELPFENVNPKEPTSDDNVKAIEVPINSLGKGESELEKFGVGKKKQRDE